MQTESLYKVGKPCTVRANFGYFPLENTELYAVNPGVSASTALMELSTLLTSIREILTVEDITNTNYGVCALVDMCQGLATAAEIGLRGVETQP